MSFYFDLYMNSNIYSWTIIQYDIKYKLCISRCPVLYITGINSLIMLYKLYNNYITSFKNIHMYFNMFYVIIKSISYNTPI